MPRDIFSLAYSVRMEAENAEEAEIMLYGEIVEDGPKWWKWSEEDKSAADFDKAVKDVKKSGAKRLLLRINSPGGICTQSVAMRSILANAGFDEINIRIEGLCASAATDIATLPGAHVAIAEGSEYMIHNPWCGAVGNASELEHAAERLRGIEKMSRGFYVKRTGQSEEQVQAWMDAETWFSAEQAVAYGFADEVLTAQAEPPAAACVTGRAMTAMRSLYRAVPGEIALRVEEGAVPEETVSNEAPVAGVSTEINKKHEEEERTMDIKDINLDQLRAGNPALLEQIRQEAVSAERQRLADIEALTLPGYEAMAEEAKANGTPAADFQRQVVAAMRQKGNAFIEQRQQETAAARNVTGGEPEARKDPEQEIRAYAKEMAAYAAACQSGGNATMY